MSISATSEVFTVTPPPNDNFIDLPLVILTTVFESAVVLVESIVSHNIFGVGHYVSFLYTLVVEAILEFYV